MRASRVSSKSSKQRKRREQGHSSLSLSFFASPLLCGAPSSLAASQWPRSPSPRCRRRHRTSGPLAAGVGQHVEERCCERVPLPSPASAASVPTSTSTSALALRELSRLRWRLCDPGALRYVLSILTKSAFCREEEEGKGKAGAIRPSLRLVDVGVVSTSSTLFQPRCSLSPFAPPPSSALSLSNRNRRFNTTPGPSRIAPTTPEAAAAFAP